MIGRLERALGSHPRREPVPRRRRLTLPTDVRIKNRPMRSRTSKTGSTTIREPSSRLSVRASAGSSNSIWNSTTSRSISAVRDRSRSHSARSPAICVPSRKATFADAGWRTPKALPLLSGTTPAARSSNSSRASETRSMSHRSKRRSRTSSRPRNGPRGGERPGNIPGS